MSGDHEELVFDVFEEPQANNFKETRKDVALEMRERFEKGDHHHVYAIQMAVDRDRLTGPDIPTLPDDFPDDASEDVVARWDAKLDTYFESKKEFEDTIHRLFFLVWGRCTRKMQMTLEKTPGYKSLRDGHDGMALLRAIRAVSYRYRSSVHPVLAAHDAAQKFFNFKQSSDMSLLEYREEFKKRWEILEIAGGGGIVGLPYLAGTDGSTKKNSPAAGQTEETMKERFLAASLIRQADKARYWSLQDSLHNRYLCGCDEYPISMRRSFDLLANWIPPR